MFLALGLYLEVNMLWLALACVDYELGVGPDAGFPYSDTAGDERTLDDVPPEIVKEDPCPDDVNATFHPDGIYVKSWDRMEDSGTLVADVAGLYHVYDYTIAESGESQTNESAYFRVTNDTNPSGVPEFANCRTDWVVIDLDNEAPLEEGSRVYVGTFWLDEGDNPLTMHHFCPIVRSGGCPDLHLTDDSGGTCDSDNPNSVHFNGEGLCLVRVE